MLFRSGVRGAFNTVIGAINWVIGAIDSIQIPAIDVGPVHFDGWDGFNIPMLPKLHTGGIVPGQPGADVLAILQAGERVVPAGNAAGGTEVHIHIDQGAYIDGPSIDLLARTIAQRLNLVGIG